MAKKKKKLSKKELAKKLKQASIKKKSLPDLKKTKDVYFRKRVNKEEASLTLSTDLNIEIRQKAKVKKSSKGEIQSQKNKIKSLEKENKKISSKVNQLKKEYPFSEPERKKEIEKLLDSPDYKKKDLFQDKNFLKYLEGKDFDFIVDDGFKKYKINVKEFKKQWKKGEDVSLPILQKMEKDSKEAIKYYDKLIEKEKKTATKQRMKKLKRIRDGLKNKLEHVIQKNIEAIETGNMKALDEYNDQGEKAYSMLFRVVGFSIDRIGI